MADQATPVSQFAHRSPWIFGLVIFDVILNFTTLIWTIIVAVKWNTIDLNYCTTMLCAIFHFILGVVSILRSRDGTRHRCCLVAGIFGSYLFVSATLAANMIEWTNRELYCRNCSNVCPDHCNTGETLVFYLVIVYSVIQYLVSTAITCISCYNVRRTRDSPQQSSARTNTSPTDFALSVQAESTPPRRVSSNNSESTNCAIPTGED